MWLGTTGGAPVAGEAATGAYAERKCSVRKLDHLAAVIDEIDVYGRKRPPDGICVCGMRNTLWPRPYSMTDRRLVMSMPCKIAVTISFPSGLPKMKRQKDKTTKR
jgi:hypothetical protein